MPKNLAEMTFVSKKIDAKTSNTEGVMTGSVDHAWRRQRNDFSI